MLLQSSSYNEIELWQEEKFETLIMTIFLLRNKIFYFFYSLNGEG